MAENIPTRPPRSRNSVAGPPRDAPPKAPAHLTPEAKGMWGAIVDEWVLGPDSLPLLRAGLESWDLYQVCRSQVMQEGATVKTGDGMIRQHPALKASNDALTQFRQCFRQLGLEPPKET